MHLFKGIIYLMSHARDRDEDGDNERQRRRIQPIISQDLLYRYNQKEERYHLLCSRAIILSILDFSFRRSVNMYICIDIRLRLIKTRKDIVLKRSYWVLPVIIISIILFWSPQPPMNIRTNTIRTRTINRSYHPSPPLTNLHINTINQYSLTYSS